MYIHLLWVDVYVRAGEAEQICYSGNSFMITVVGGKRLKKNRTGTS